MSDLHPHPTAPKREGQILLLVLVREDGVLKFRFEWKAARLSDEEKYEAAKAVEGLLRYHVPEYKHRVAEIDRAAKIGWRVDKLPPMVRKIVYHYIEKKESR